MHSTGRLEGLGVRDEGGVEVKQELIIEGWIHLQLSEELVESFDQRRWTDHLLLALQDQLGDVVFSLIHFNFAFFLAQSHHSIERLVAPSLLEIRVRRRPSLVGVWNEPANRVDELLGLSLVEAGYDELVVDSLLALLDAGVLLHHGSEELGHATVDHLSGFPG